MARILVAGDEQRLLLDLLAFWLTGQGHEVVILVDRPEDVADTSGARFDLAVLDYLRPTGPCARMVQLLRAHPHDGGAPIILLTGSATEQEIDEAVANGVTAHLHEPFALPELSAVIDRLLWDEGPSDRGFLGQAG